MITCYNIADYIDTAVESAVNQELPFEWELLIGDDGSNDGTYEKAMAWMGNYPKNIQVFQMPRKEQNEKTGYRAARNRANLLRHASGDYLIFLDGDDCFLDSRKIITQVNFLESEKYRSCSCCAHNILVNYVETGEKKDMLQKRIGNTVLTAKAYWKDYYFHPNTILFRKSCVPLMLEPLYSDYLNDNFITYLILQQGDILYVDKTMAQYNITGQGLWTGKKRVYGVFRNLKLYDLEIRVNPKMRKESFMRHVSDFNHVFSQYASSDMPLINPLFENVNTANFPISYLLFKKNDCELANKVRVVLLRIKTRIVLRYCQTRTRIREKQEY